jgi:DNA-binding NarL/FixJ family response regulator
MPELSRTRILIVDDHHIIRAGLTSTLESEGWGEVVQADSLKSALELISEENFDLILTDQHLGDGEGLHLAQPALLKNSQVKLALFTFEESWTLIESARNLGFSLFISKRVSLRSIVQSLTDTLVGKELFAIHAPSLPRESGLNVRLTKSELEVLRLMSQGCTTREIALRRYSSEATIKSHTSAIFRKLHSRNRVEALIKARELRLISST